MSSTISSTFSGYGIAVSGMSSNQAALSVTSHNLSNLNTTGSSRQRIIGEDLTIQQGTVSVGSGTSVQEVNRARNQLLDQTYRQQNAKLGYWEAKSANLEDAALTLNEFSSDDGTSDNGLQQTIAEFFSSWEELAKDPSSLSSRQALLESAQSLVDTVTEIDAQLQQLQLDAASKAKSGVAQLNTLATQVADLNAKIAQAEALGGEASDLRDQRDTLLDSMSNLANITTNEQQDGTITVSIGGVSLVQGKHTHTLVATGDGSVDNPLEVKWAELNQNAQLESGSIRAYLEDADQSGVAAIDSTDIPYDYSASSSSSIGNLRQGLNALITTLALKINEIHSSGTGLDGSTGLDFFVAADSSRPLSSSNIAVNSALTGNSNAIAASTSGDAGDNTAANEIAQLVSGTYFKFDGLSMNSDTFYQTMTSWLGTAGDNANSFYENQNSLVTQIDNQRLSVSSISMDEEMSKMIMYQNAYSASARVLSAIDGLIKDMIDELG